MMTLRPRLEAEYSTLRCDRAHELPSSRPPLPVSASATDAVALYSSAACVVLIAHACLGLVLAQLRHSCIGTSIIQCSCRGNCRVNSQSATSAFLSLSFDTQRALPTISRQVDWTFKGVLPKTDFNGVHAVRRFGIVVHLQPTGDLAYTTSHRRTYPPRDTTAATWLARPTPTRWSGNPELPERRGRVSPRRKSTTDVLLSCSERASPGSGGSSCTEARLVALLLMTKTEQADSSARASESPAGQPARNCSRAS